MTHESDPLPTETRSQRNRNEQTSDEHTGTTTKNPTTTESNTDDTTTKAMTDGGTEGIRSSNDVRQSDDEVRRYSSINDLYAYHEGNEHVVVSRGDFPHTRWIERVPAERDAVLAGEHLWTIPENWRYLVEIKYGTETQFAIYRIPETGVDVLVTVPNKDRLADAWYGVKRVGRINITFDDQVDWGELKNMIETIRDTNEVSEPVINALETLHDHRHSVEHKFAAYIERYAPEALFSNAPKPVSINTWTIAPWSHSIHVDDLLQEYFDFDNETRDGVLDELSTSNVFPNHPTVRVGLEGGEDIPQGYEIHALVETGASCAETIDYLMTEQYDQLTQTDWAKYRRKESSTINKNVKAAENELTD